MFGTYISGNADYDKASVIRRDEGLSQRVLISPECFCECFGNNRNRSAGGGRSIGVQEGAAMKQLNAEGGKEIG